MSHPLDGCVARLDWTQTYLESLERVLTTQYAHEDTADPFTRMDLDLDVGTLAIVMVRDMPVPLEIGIIFGEVCRALHATLDNLAYALGSIDNKIPERDRRSAFPILIEANEWFTEATATKLHFIRPRDRALIEGLQPFMRNGGREPHQDALARIAAYSNRDKHRIITPAASSLLNSTVRSLDAHDCRIEVAEVEKFVRLRKDAVVLRASVVDIGTDPRVEMHGTIDWIPTIENDEPIEHFCMNAVGYIRAIVKDLFWTSFD